MLASAVAAHREGVGGLVELENGASLSGEEERQGLEGDVDYDGRDQGDDDDASGPNQSGSEAVFAFLVQNDGLLVSVGELIELGSGHGRANSVEPSLHHPNP